MPYLPLIIRQNGRSRLLKPRLVRFSAPGESERVQDRVQYYLQFTVAYLN